MLSKTSIFYTITIVLSSVITLSGAELLLRINEKSTSYSNFNYNSDLGWIPNKKYDPDTKDFIEDSNYKFFPAVSSSTIKHNILLLGDSFAQGGQIENGLRDSLSCYSQDFNIINLGVGGYGTIQERVMWNKYGKEYDPSLVILQMYMWNDIGDNLNDIMYWSDFDTMRPFYRHEYCSPDNSLSWGRDVTMLFSKEFYRKFALVRFVEKNLWHWLCDGEYKDSGSGNFKQYKDFYIQPLNKRAKVGYEITERELKRIISDFKSSNVNYIFIYFDNPFTVEKETEDFLLEKYGDVANSMNVDYPTTWAENISRLNGFNSINITKILKDHRKQSNTPLYDPSINGHFTNEAGKVIGEVLVKYILENKLLNAGLETSLSN